MKLRTRIALLMPYCTTALILRSSGHYPQAFPVVTKHSFIFVLAASLSLSGCMTATAVQVVGTAVNLALESSGLKSSEKDASHAPRALPIRLNAGEVVNATEDGESLALLVRVYQLRHDAAFAQLAYSQAGQTDEEKRVLGEDLVAVRELMLLPGKSVTLDEKLPAEAKVIGVVALFRAPAHERWKMALNTDASASDGHIAWIPCLLNDVGYRRTDQSHCSRHCAQSFRHSLQPVNEYPF